MSHSWCWRAQTIRLEKNIAIIATANPALRPLWTTSVNQNQQIKGQICWSSGRQQPSATYMMMDQQIESRLNFPPDLKHASPLKEAKTKWTLEAKPRRCPTAMESWRRPISAWQISGILKEIGFRSTRTFLLERLHHFFYSRRSDVVAVWGFWSQSSRWTRSEPILSRDTVDIITS